MIQTGTDGPVAPIRYRNAGADGRSFNRLAGMVKDKEQIPETPHQTWKNGDRWYILWPLDADREPWEKQAHETPKAYAAFGIYRDMGATRSLSKTSIQLLGMPSNPRLLQRPKRSISVWNKIHRWGERVRLWDEYLDSESRRAQVSVRTEMLDRHILLAKTFQRKVQERLETLDATALSPQDLAKWLEVAVKVERLGQGEASEKVDIESKIEEMARQLGMDPGAAKIEALRLIKGGIQ